MIEISLVQNDAELQQIYELNLKNLKQNLPDAEKEKEGFVTWLYTRELLQQMHQLAPSIIAKDGDKVAGYALVTPKEAGVFHPDLSDFFANLQHVTYRERLLFDHNFYCMGQVCIDKAYRGQGIFDKLYQGHRQFYQQRYSLLVTEISTLNIRSQKAHERVGFNTIHTYRDQLDEWNVVVWDWELNR